MDGFLISWSKINNIWFLFLFLVSCMVYKPQTLYTGYTVRAGHKPCPLQALKAQLQTEEVTALYPHRNNPQISEQKNLPLTYVASVWNSYNANSLV